VKSYLQAVKNGLQTLRLKPHAPQSLSARIESAITQAPKNRAFHGVRKYSVTASICLLIVGVNAKLAAVEPDQLQQYDLGTLERSAVGERGRETRL
jgi:hypothetical protein